MYGLWIDPFFSFTQQFGTFAASPQNKTKTITVRKKLIIQHYFVITFSGFLFSSGCPQVLLDKIQRVINCSARLIYKASKPAHITPLLFDLHWLPISSQIQYKIALTFFHIISGTASPYLSELLHLYSPPRYLRSASDTQIFRVPRCAGGLLGRDPFSISDLSSGTLFLSLSGMPRHSSF